MIFDVFYMFPTSWVYRQEDSLSNSFCMVFFSYIYVRSLADGRVYLIPTINSAKNVNYCNKFQKIWKFLGILKVLAGVDVFLAVYMCEVKICTTFKCNPVPTWCVNRGQGWRRFILMEEIRILMQVPDTLFVFLYLPLAIKLSKYTKFCDILFHGATY